MQHLILEYRGFVSFSSSLYLCLFFFLSICPYVFIFFCLSVFLFICLSVCLCLCDMHDVASLNLLVKWKREDFEGEERWQLNVKFLLTILLILLFLLLFLLLSNPGSMQPATKDQAGPASARRGYERYLLVPPVERRTNYAVLSDPYWYRQWSGVLTMRC